MAQINLSLILSFDPLTENGTENWEQKCMSSKDSTDPANFVKMLLFSLLILEKPRIEPATPGLQGE